MLRFEGRPSWLIQYLYVDTLKVLELATLILFQFSSDRPIDDGGIARPLEYYSPARSSSVGIVELASMSSDSW